MTTPNSSALLGDSGLKGLEEDPTPHGDTIDLRGWGSLTLAAYPLKRPEIASREVYKKESPVTKKSTLWLQERSRGLGLLHWFMAPDYYSRNGVMVGLFYRLDSPKEQVVIKQVSGNPFFRLSSDVNGIISEIEYMTLEDPAALRALKCDPIHYPIVQMHAVQIHNLGTRFPNDSLNWHGDAQYTLFMKYYNGGHLFNLFEKHQRGRQLESGGYGSPEQVPEIFIWHYIAQVGRAYAYLHTGHAKTPEENIKNNNHLKKDLKHSTLENWVPIGHNNGHWYNIWLHYPSTEEKQKDPRLKVFDARFPQVVLADFGMARDLDHDVYDEYRSTKIPGLTDPGTWLDKMYFGLSLKLLLFAFDKRVREIGNNREYIFNSLANNDKANGKVDGIKYTKVADCEIMKAKYSDELLRITSKFEDMMDFAGEWKRPEQSMPFLSHFLNENLPKQKRWENWPSNDWFYGWVIAMADHMLDRYRNEPYKREDSVMWTKGITGTMPYRAFGPQRWPFTATQDFQHVHTTLVSIRTTTLTHWPPGSVKVMAVKPRGGLYHDLARTIFRDNQTLGNRRSKIRVAKKRYKYPLLDNFEVVPEIEETSTSNQGAADPSSLHHQSSRPHVTNVSSSSIGSQSCTTAGEDTAGIQAQVKKPLKENYLLMTRHLAKLDFLRSHQFGIIRRGALSESAKTSLAAVDEQVKELWRAKNSFWMEVGRRKSDDLQKNKTKEKTIFQARQRNIQDKRDAAVPAMANLRRLDGEHKETIRRIDQESRNLRSLIKWWKNQLSLIKSQQFREGGPRPVPRDPKSEPESIDEWSNAGESDSSASFKRSTILPGGDLEYEKRAHGRLVKFCEYIERVGYLDDPDISLRGIANQTAFWAADDTILPEVQEEAADNTFVEGASILVSPELIEILKDFFGQKDGGLTEEDMDKTIREIIDAADDSTILPSTARRTAPAQKKIPLAEYYRKLYAGQNPWATENEASDDDNPPAMAKTSRVITIQDLEDLTDGGIHTLSRNLQIPRNQGELVARVLPGRYTGTVPLEEQPQPMLHTRTIRGAQSHSTLVSSPERLRQGPRPWDTMDDFLNSGMGSSLFPQRQPSVFNAKRFMKARYLRLEGDITLEEYVRNGQKKLLEESIRLEEKFQYETSDDDEGGEEELGFKEDFVAEIPGTGMRRSKRGHRLTSSESDVKRRKVG